MSDPPAALLVAVLGVLVTILGIIVAPIVNRALGHLFRGAAPALYTAFALVVLILGAVALTVVVVAIPAIRRSEISPPPTPRPTPSPRGTPTPVVATPRPPPPPSTPAPIHTPEPVHVEEPAPPELAMLKISVTPWAEVTLDGQQMGTTPFRPLHLALGTHTIWLSHPDYLPVRRVVVITSGENVLRVDLTQEAPRRRGAEPTVAAPCEDHPGSRARRPTRSAIRAETPRSACS